MRSNRITCRCLVCGTEFPEKPSRIAVGKGKYCSTDCRNAARTTRFDVPCQVCGKSFITFPSRVEVGGGRFCSKRCEGTSRVKEPVVCTCKACGKTFLVAQYRVAQGSGVHCSVDCRDASQRGSERPWTRKQANCICETCGGPFRMGPGLIENGLGRFCSNACKGLSQRTPVVIPDDERDLIYMAGIIDGEGTISAWLREDTGTGRASLSYRIIIGNTYMPLMEWLRDTFGGNLSTPHAVRSVKHKPVTTWHISSSAAIILCRSVLPYLKIKRRQAEILIELAGLSYTKGNGIVGRFVSETTREARVLLIEEIRRLNHRGVSFNG